MIFAVINEDVIKFKIIPGQIFMPKLIRYDYKYLTPQPFYVITEVTIDDFVRQEKLENKWKPEMDFYIPDWRLRFKFFEVTSD